MIIIVDDEGFDLPKTIQPLTSRLIIKKLLFTSLFKTLLGYL
jgi:hypothetical protein